MLLVKVQGNGAIVDLSSMDCALLAELCRRGSNDLTDDEENLQQAGDNYAALFAALAVAGVGLNNLLPVKQAELAQDLAPLGLRGLVFEKEV